MSDYILINGRGEHLIIVEKFIGRKLLKSERVHHINLKKKITE